MDNTLQYTYAEGTAGRTGYLVDSNTAYGDSAAQFDDDKKIVFYDTFEEFVQSYGNRNSIYG